MTIAISLNAAVEFWVKFDAGLQDPQIPLPHWWVGLDYLI